MASETPSQKPKICFVSPYNYPLFNPQVSGNFGGWEVQIYQIAKEIARRGTFRVSIIVADMGQPERETRQGVELIAWKGKPFWGISGTEALQHSEARPVPAAPPRAGRFNGVKRIYKRAVSWRLRVVLHGLLTGLAAAPQVLFYHLRVALKVALHAQGMVGDTPMMSENQAVFDLAGADVYIAPGVSDISALTAWYCRARSKPYVMLAGSDRDFNPATLQDPDGRDTYGTPNALLLYSLRHAARHIVQNETQARLAAAFGISPVLITNPMDLSIATPRASDPQSILWVGNTEEAVKQPALMLRVARDLPQYTFTMIVTPVDPTAYIRLAGQAQRLPNVRLLARIPFGEVERYFAEARLLVNTSVFEGFPNTFLQAGKYGVPVVSLNVDPDGMLARRDCGLVCAGDYARLQDSLCRLMSDEALYSRQSANIRQYVQQAHNPEDIIPRYEAVFRSVL